MTQGGLGDPGASCGPVDDVEAYKLAIMAALAYVNAPSDDASSLACEVIRSLVSALSALVESEREAVGHLRECMGHMPVIPEGRPEYERRYSDLSAFRRAHEFLARRSKS